MYHHRLELFGVIPEVQKTEEFIETITPSIYRELKQQTDDIIDYIFQNEKDIILYRYIFEHHELKKLFKKEQIISETYEHMHFPEDDIIQKDFLVGTAHIKIDDITQIERLGILSTTSIYGARIYSDMILYNYHKGILLYIYDDRGCDVFFENKSDFDDFYKHFKININYYNDWPNRQQQ